jgi:hypothetical protein
MGMGMAGVMADAFVLADALHFSVGWLRCNLWLLRGWRKKKRVHDVSGWCQKDFFFGYSFRRM